MARQYFGTDGIRDKVGSPHMHPEFLLKLGWAVGCVLGGAGISKVLVGKDTRLSGYMIESALESGLAASGVDVVLVGPMPTPAIAYLTQTQRAQAGIVISASHNPFDDNGVKFFNERGFKLYEKHEEAIEAKMHEQMVCVSPGQTGRASRLDDAPGRYIEFCKSTIPKKLRLAGLKIVVDCAHGAAYHIAPAVFHELGAEVIVIGNTPDGLNINAGFGATDTAALQAAVIAHQADCGVALDGDADRCILVDHTGVEVDGDEILAMLVHGEFYQDRPVRGVIGTLMTNLGLEQYLKEMRVAFERVDVGDRYVMASLVQRGWSLGGEGSGHIVNLDMTTTGDGIVTALQVLRVMIQTQKRLHDLKQIMTKRPQVLINVSAKQPRQLAVKPDIIRALKQVESELGEKGRVLLRPSGTQPCVRVMVEANDADVAQKAAEALADVVRQTVC